MGADQPQGDDEKMNNGSEKKKSENFHSWVKGLDPNALSLWREAMAQLRQLSTDVWNGVRFFLTINGIMLAATFAVLSFDRTPLTDYIIVILVCIGLSLTLIAMIILSRQRNNYLDMLIRKTFMEKEFGFYDVSLHNVNLSFPWSISKDYIATVTANPDKWKNEHRFRKSTISRWLWIVYWVFFVLYIVALIAVAIGV